MIRSILYILIILSLWSCAQKGAPSGGPKDITPPKFLKAEPDTFATNVPTNTKQFKLEFDEYITLKDPGKQILISPPLNSIPTIYPSGMNARKYVLIEFKEGLNENTTYNINFGESIQDFNEGNKLSLFNYIISTGDYIDSLKLDGSVKQALERDQNLNTVLALYKKDSAEIDLKEKPYYVSKIDSSGNFNFEYLHQGDYQLIGFTDENINLRYDPGELIAFTDTIVNPSQPQSFQMTLAPNKPAFKILKSIQSAQGELQIEMQGKPEKITITPIDENFVENYQVIHKTHADTAFIFFNDALLPFKESKERIKFQVQHKEQLDSVSILYDKKKESDLRIKFRDSQHSPNQSVYLNSTTAIQAFNTDSISIFEDSVSVNFEVKIDSINPKLIRLDFPVNFEKSYSIEMFPGAFHDQILQTNDSLNLSFKTMAQNEYGNLVLTVMNAPRSPYFFQLMSQDKVLKTFYGTQSKFEMKSLFPGEYYFRILVDTNENGVWDSADFNNNQQPEPTFIYNNNILIRAFWDLNETWNLP